MGEIICIVGPTASGKTKLSIALARAMGAEIISFDSMQIYRHMDIGTAKPTPEERLAAPHHMLDFLDPKEAYSVGRYVQEADACLQGILSRGKPVILVGGTGLYIDSLMAGRSFAPTPASGRREELTALADAEGIEAVLAQLRLVDPEAAQTLHPSNRKRIIRAMEVYLETGKTITAHNAETKALPPKYQPLWIGLDFEDRNALYARINRRVEAMFAQGLASEVQALLDAGVPERATSLQAIGYKEILAALRSGAPAETAREEIALRSRRYAKRQLTWFRRNRAVSWLQVDRYANFDTLFNEIWQIRLDSTSKS
ncbi:MAG: tRNA (adenosine(37)-N6)-dimethylallyltransferase MiaA [Oscillospiraceae bacterium]|jgi:tRNA dimethylallyltransferase|nr:tRNA (adenosine(37)-N6)-dimethylallyltransferase MiaA [Oscillospiraceae bacterium]